uniref:Reverse transcriptase domain-containing protein n=1 Tax=Tanacetum cinerariifolium TaxID=118510 RepID=A0A6L2MPC6_TANCI|nr:reverse transcriptase domain-containing protein [Tanacetum cinerariifolium]
MRCGKESRLSSGERRLPTPPKSLDLLGGKRVLVKPAGQRTRMGPEIEVIEEEKEEAWGTYSPYARRKGFTPLTKTPKENLPMDNVNFPPPPPMVGTLEKQNMNKFCDYHQDRGHNMNDCYHLKKQIEEAVALGRLAHLVKNIRKSGQKIKAQPKENRRLSTCCSRDRININSFRGFDLSRYYKDDSCWSADLKSKTTEDIISNRSFMEVLVLNHYVLVKKVFYQTRSRLRESQNPLVGFSREVNYPLGVIDLEVTMGEYGRTRIVIMKFVVVKSMSSYNALLGRTEIRSLGAIASTINSMIKFPTSNGIANITTTRETLRECRQIEEAQALSWNARITDPSPMQTSSEVINPRCLLAPVETCSWRPGKEPMQLDDVEERRQPDKGKKLTKSSVEEKILVNDNYPEQLVTIGGDMTGISWAIMEHSLDTYPHIKPKVQKKRSLALDRRNVMTTKDEEKTTFHTKERVFCYMKMHFGLKNARATYQRLVDSAFKEQIGVNLEAYVDDMAAEVAFLEMKKLVSKLPTLTTTKKGETLMMYLVMANDTVSTVLLTERDGRQMHIHYVIQSLQGEETNYALMEKLALALVHATRIFKCKGKYYSWPNGMELYTDGASNNGGSGVGLILRALDDVKYSCVLCLNFSNSNNEAEYEALLVGLRIATKILPKADMISITSTWPFMKWGIDTVRPLSKGPGRVKYLIMATDYFTKWMEAKPLATITDKQVVNFTWDNIVCRFGIQATIITDNETYFVNDPFKKWDEISRSS